MLAEAEAAHMLSSAGSTPNIRRQPVTVLETFGKRPQAAVEGCRVIPERCVSRVRHHLDVSVSQANLVLIDCGRFDNGITSAMRNQYRLADLT